MDRQMVVLDWNEQMIGVLCLELGVVPVVFMYVGHVIFAQSCSVGTALYGRVLAGNYNGMLQ